MNYTEKSEEEIINWLKAHLSENRFLHSTGCAKSAAELAKIFHLDEKKAHLAGLLHDCAKNFSREDSLEIIEKYMPQLDECEKDNHKILHAPVSSCIAEKEFKIKDKEIISAIRWHTLGRIGMTDFEKIIFLADKIEPHTRDLEYRKEIQSHLTKSDGLNKALLICYEKTIESIVKRHLPICQITIDVYNELLILNKQ